MQLDSFLQEFDMAQPGSTTDSSSQRNENDTLRNKVDAIADRVRHNSLPSNTNGDGSTHGVHNPTSPHNSPQHEIPVRTRLDTIETMLKEIRDNMKMAAMLPAQTGQAQPRGVAAANPMPAVHHHELNRTSDSGTRPGTGHVTLGQPQLQGAPLGRTQVANDWSGCSDGIPDR